MADDLALYAHLTRRAGFSARRSELEELAKRPYEEVVEDLLHPERFEDVEIDLLERYYGTGQQGENPLWWFRMLNSPRQLEEKMTLFWHGIFATGSAKSGHSKSSHDQILLFRSIALTDIRTLLTKLSQDPAMIFWLDNNENLKKEPNENFGRELLELFSMGVGNYTEEDVKASAFAFTGWTHSVPIPGAGSKYGGYSSDFVFEAGEHDNGAKSFLGESGRFNGEDIVDVVVRQPATARFIARHLYTFFVADEPPVASWNELPPRDPEAIDQLTKAYTDTGGDVRSILRVLFNADFFKKARYTRVKSPVEVVAGVLKLVGTYQFPDPDINKHVGVTGGMGQQLMNPLSVEGWHTGPEWIDGGTLNERVNYAVNELPDASVPGIRDIVERLAANGGSLSPTEFVDRCLDLAGPVVVNEDGREGLQSYAESGGDLKFDSDVERMESEDRVARMLQLIVSTREYQFN